MTKLILGVANEWNMREELTIGSKGECINGECICGYHEELQMNTYLIDDSDNDRIVIGIDGNHQDEKIRWIILPKDENFDIERFYDDDIILSYFFLRLG